MFSLVAATFWAFPQASGLWARQDLNLQPTDYESAALTWLSYGPAASPPVASRRAIPSYPIVTTGVIDLGDSPE